jgi:adapter protein MecA 1/2
MLYDGFIEMQVRVEGNDNLLYEFESIEEIIQLAKRLISMKICGGNLYCLNNRYYLFMDHLDHSNLEKTASILSEYGEASILSPYILAEYGKKIIENNAVETIHHFFK